MTAPALIVIDVQQGLDDPKFGPRSTPEAEGNIVRLLAAWRERGLPLYHVQHHSVEAESPLRPDRPGVAFKPEAEPHAGEPVIVKHVNSAFIGTDLEARLRDAGIEEVVLCGLTTQHCVSTSARMAGNLGFRTVVVADATAAHPATDARGERYDAELVHRVSLATLHGEFAEVLPTDAVLARLAPGLHSGA